MGVANRDFSRVAGWVRRRPTMASIWLRGFGNCPSSTDGAFYDDFLVEPFGFVGAPVHFRLSDDAIQAPRRGYSPPEQSGRADFLLRINVLR